MTALLTLKSPLRIVSVLITVFFLLILSWDNFISLFWAILLCHYGLALYYALPKLRSVQFDMQTWVVLIITNIVWMILAFTEVITIEMYFGIHFAFTEAYVFKNFLLRCNIPAQKLETFFISRIFFSFFTYVILVRGVPQLLLIPYFVFLAAMYFYVFRLGVQKHGFFRDFAIFDSIEVLLAIGFLFAGIKINFNIMIFYHLMYWLLFPLQKFLSTPQITDPKKTIAVFFGLNIVISAILFLATPAFPVLAQFDSTTFVAISTIGGFIHITLTFVTSDSNPGFLRRLLLDRG